MTPIIIEWLLILGARLGRRPREVDDLRRAWLDGRPRRLRITACVMLAGLLAAAPLQLVIPWEDIRIGVGVAGMLVIVLGLWWAFIEVRISYESGHEDEAERAVARLVSGGGIVPVGTPPTERDPAGMGGGGFEPP